MNNSEKHIARLLFKTKVYELDQQSFEDLFSRVMSHDSPHFTPIKPQGRYGDRKNDGYNTQEGKYYQVYAPEDLRFKESDAVDKLRADFEGLKSWWDSEGKRIKEFYFVVNDKYRGIYPTLASAVNELNEANPNIDISILETGIWKINF